MAKPIVTKELVFEIASRLITENVEPSIMNVQTRLGGGSYTTVKRYLDEWRQSEKEKIPATSEVPGEISQKSEELVRTIWAFATQLAQREVAAIKEEALAKSSQAQEELSNALHELQRLEQLEAEQKQALEEKSAQIRELELKVAAMAVETKRALGLQTELDIVRASLARADQEAVSLRQQAEKGNAVQSMLTELQTKVEELIAAQKPDKKKP